VLIEAGARLLSGFSEEHSAYARHALSQKGVEVITSRPVIGCGPRGVNLPDESIEAGVIIWAAGVVASPVATWLGAEHDRAGRVTVEPDLSLPTHPEIFVVGDAASVHSGGRPVPGTRAGRKANGTLRGVG
jgi:NADH:ubiquinone reductase (H+-translocating)